MDIIVEVKNLSKTFDEIKAVNDLSFTVHKADVYGFLGQNGAGKSTTIRMLLSLIRPTSGEVKIFGKDLHSERRYILERTGAIIERPDLYKYLSALDNLSIFARMSGIRASRTSLLEKLDFVGLGERAGSKVKTFSQGMKQRLGLAVALVHDPELIILDEPTNGLDPQGIADMRKLILSLSHDLNKTVIISSHLLNEIEQMANRMLIINRGTRIAEGDVAEMLDPANISLTIETNDNSGAASLLNKNELLKDIRVKEKYLMITTNKIYIPQLIRQLSDEGIDIYSVESKNKLEEYFISLTNEEKYVEPVAN